MQIQTPRAYLPLLNKARFKGARGGRGSGKSHAFADNLIERMVAEPDLRWACIREVQKSLRFSAKSLVEGKIQQYGVGHMFDVQRELIQRIDGSGVVIFNGMQDHTADSIKSLEGFDGAWIEEGQSISKRSWELLEPTIRKADSEIWVSWNPDQPTDPIDKFFVEHADDSDVVLVSTSIYDNPFASDTLWSSYHRDRERAIKHQRAGDKGAWAKFLHTWHGEYDLNSESLVLAGHYEIGDFEPQDHWEGAYYGVDWGFATDPTVMTQSYVGDRVLYVYDEAYGERIETVDLPKLFAKLPDASKHVIRADNARPEQISHCKRHGYPRMTAVDKWAGSVEDGVSWLKGLDKIIIHSRCKHTIAEAAKWSYKVDRYTGDVLPKLVDADNHCWDAIRYSVQPLIKTKPKQSYALMGNRTF